MHNILGIKILLRSWDEWMEDELISILPSDTHETLGFDKCTGLSSMAEANFVS